MLFDSEILNLGYKYICQILWREVSLYIIVVLCAWTGKSSGEIYEISKNFHNRVSLNISGKLKCFNKVNN